MTPAALLSELDAREITHVVLRPADLLADGEVGKLRVLIERDDLGAVEQVARQLRLAPQPSASPFERSWVTNGNCRSSWRLSVLGELAYGGVAPCLVTGEAEHRVVARRQRRAGISVAAPSDELVDLVLHCLLDARAFTPQSRRRLVQLMSALRADPPSAGRAAERVQQELAPALTWSQLLSDIVGEGWDRLLARRRRLAWQLALRSPLGTLQRLVVGLVRRRGKVRAAGVPTTSPAAAPELNAPRDETTDSEPTGHAAGWSTRPSSESLARKQIRGSGLLLAGRGLSSGLKFGAEVMVVRYLATDAYGAWSYALAAVAVLRGMSALGLNRAISRYLPLHLERNEPEEFYGVLVLVFGSLALAGGLVVGAFYAFPGQVAGLGGISSTEPLPLLLILIFLVPVETIDNALTGVCAAFGDSRTIFVRRFLLHPGLRFGVAGVLVLLQAEVTLLAYGYLLSGVIGIAYYAWSVVEALRRRGLLRADLLRGVRLPVRKVLSYTAPVMASDWCQVFMVTAGPLLLGYFANMSAVAVYQVVVPVAALNTLVHQSFVMLYEPSASRLIAREDRSALDGFYWRAAVWVAVLTFPMFALSFTAAVPLTVFLFGERYVAAAPILSLLAFAQYFDAMAGFNAATLRVSGKLQWLVGVNVVGAMITVGLCILLIPWLGAMGAAISAAVAHVVYTLLKQVALQIVSGVPAFDSAYAGPYATMVLVTAVLLATRLAWADHPWIVVPAAALGSLLVLASARMSLRVSDTFPELARSPLLRRILG